MKKEPCKVHVPSLATGFFMLDSAPYCAVCFKKLEAGDPVTHQLGSAETVKTPVGPTIPEEKK